MRVLVTGAAGFIGSHVCDRLIGRAAITEVVGMEQDTVVMQDIFRYNQTGIDETGRCIGEFVSTGIRPTFMDRLEQAGVRLPASAFRERTMLVDE